MKIKNLHISRFYCLLLILPILGCNSKGYQNLNARYNGYFYADQYVNEVYQAFEDKYQYNFDEILDIFPEIDSATVKSNKEKLDDAFKKSSQTIEWWETSDWVDDSYLIIGKIRYLRSQWQFSVETFQYINQNSKDEPTRHKALIALMKVYMDRGEQDQAQEVAQFIEQENLDETNTVDFLLTSAALYQRQEEYEKVKDLLERAQPKLQDKVYKIRVNFILGQLAQAAAEYRDAYLYYDNALKGNPPYKIMFHAKLNKLAVSGLSNPRNVDGAYQVFEKMLKDGKNLEYQDNIYYTMGQLEQNRKNLPKAIENYVFATQVEQPNQRIQGLSFLRLGEIYFDDLENFNLASAYYDSAITKLPKEIENFEAISKRQVVLKDFVTQLNTITKNDSLLALAEMNPVSLEAYLSRYLDDKEAKEKAKAKKEQVSNSAGVNRVDESGFEAPDGSATWYFYNQQAVGQGQLEFQRLWGNRPLENNWRRSIKQAIGITNTANVSEEELETNPNLGAPQPNLKSSREKDIADLLATIPKTPEDKEKANLEIQDAYFNLGRIYRFGLEQNTSSIDAYETVLKRYPETIHRIDALYALFTLYEPINSAEAQRYKQMIIDEFPETILAKTLINPNYLQEKAARNRALQLEYASAYNAYEAGDYISADQKLRSALNSFEDVDFLPTVELLAAILKAKTESIVSYEQALNEFIEKYPEEPQADYAKRMRAAISPAKQEILGNLKKEFSQDFQQIHLVAFTFSEGEMNSTDLKKKVEEFNEGNFESSRLAVSYLNFDPTKKVGLLFVSTFKVKSASEIYRKELEKALNELKLQNDPNYHNFAISRDNLTQLFQDKALEDYLAFHKKFYK